LNKFESFVCHLYGKTTSDSVDKARYDKVRQSFRSTKSLLSSSTGLDLSRLPPCQNVLNLHIKRANYQTWIWRNSSFPEAVNAVSVEEMGWKKDDSGVLQIDWHSGSFLPDELSNILPTDEGTDELSQEDLNDDDVDDRLEEQMDEDFSDDNEDDESDSDSDGEL